ncbi:MAG: putative endonuclease [Patescibacteria group bacterium]|nr:putative endonuclease [Patescibacteria group bacterium]
MVIIMAEHNKIGKIGEEIAVKYLLGKKFNIVERNYLCKIGEIDIISHENDSLIFIEVKSKKVKTFLEIKNLDYKPEDNMSYKKKLRMKRAIRHYLSFKKIDEYKKNIEVVLVVVFIEEITKKAKIKIYRNIIL